MAKNLKIIGSVMVGFSVILLFILIFVKHDFDKQSLFLCEAFQESNLDMSQCPAHKSNVSWLIIMAYSISFLMLGTGIYLIFIPQAQPIETKKEFKEIDVSIFSEDEKLLYDIIKSKGGSAYQSDIIKESGFTKVKTTRVLDKLEMMDILERKRRGMTNIVVLK